MELKNLEQETSQRKAFAYVDGKLVFSKKTEKNIFFILTLIMLSWGAVLKLSDLIK